MKFHLMRVGTIGDEAFHLFSLQVYIDQSILLSNGKVSRDNYAMIGDVRVRLPKYSLRDAG